MDILGKNPAGTAYRVAIDLDGSQTIALVPDALLSEQYGVMSMVSHTQAYEWIAAHQHDLTDAITKLSKGAPLSAPFTTLTLE